MTDLSTIRSTATPPYVDHSTLPEQEAAKLSESMQNRSATLDPVANTRAQTPKPSSPKPSEAKPAQSRLGARLHNFWKEKITTPFHRLRTRKGKIAPSSTDSRSRLSRFKAALTAPFTRLSTYFKNLRDRRTATTQPKPKPQTEIETQQAARPLRDLTGEIEAIIETIKGADAKSLETIKNLLKARAQKYANSSLSDENKKNFLFYFGKVKLAMEGSKEGEMLDPMRKERVIDYLRIVDIFIFDLNKGDKDLIQFEREQPDFVGKAQAQDEMQLSPEIAKINDLFQKRVENYAPKYQGLPLDKKRHFVFSFNRIKEAIANHQEEKAVTNLQLLDSASGIVEAEDLKELIRRKILPESERVTQPDINEDNPTPNP